MRIEKDYFALPEILERWSIAEDDLIYLAENDIVRFSIRVFNLPLEFGDHAVDADGPVVNGPREERRFSGLLDLHASDVFHLFRAGEAALREFRQENSGCACVVAGQAEISTVIGDLLMRRGERDRYEIETGFHAGRGEAPEQTFIYAKGYREVRCRGRRFQLGAIQAEIVGVLHKAAEAGQPWRNGKEMLTAVGSRSLKMVDVFKSKEDWRELIQSDGRGNYRLRVQ